jgi:hypothetical protein
MKIQKRQEKERRRMAKRDAPRAPVEIVSAEEVIGPLRSIAETMAEITGGGRTHQGAAPLPVKLFVGSLSDSTTSSSLEAAFKPFGDILEAAVILDRNSGVSREFGFVTMADRKDAPRAIEAMDGSELDGSRIVVSIATERR